ncbi:MAG: ketopantoate reductase family protein [Saccharofermentans sp.]|nr:ketopantoate reductase family protein [Saccharofermentans sp.]
MKRIERISVVGLGALGMVFGRYLQDDPSCKVSFLMDPERYEKHSKEVYYVNGSEYRFNLVHEDEAEPSDLVIVSVKYTGLQRALDTMKKAVGPDTIIVSLLNGIDSEEIISERYPGNPVIYSIAQGMDAMRFGTELNFTKHGNVYIGIPADEAASSPVFCDHEAFDSLTELFDRTGFPYVKDDDILHRLWSKFMMNVGCNQVCMVYGTGYGGCIVPASEEKMAMVAAMRETIAVAAAEGISLTEDDIHFYLDLIAGLDKDSSPSMAQDRMSGRKSEVEMFSGIIIKLGRKHNIEVPVNEYLYRRVHEIEAQY